MELCLGWGNWLRAHPHVHQLRGQPVYIGDGIKVGKEGNKMPGNTVRLSLKSM
ncbi:hypothetical protein [Moorena sp. SIO3A2]|uniref:hypothetical protein n=1 Tax=Moorena sp. SIO3A2 TaxID=2607841 RepID=UPI0013B67994|nr:hypothetical protein [Moorena sp. SIO3A2]NER87129.1 hypothetical protein [Moorena sp. SIO3A2]